MDRWNNRSAFSMASRELVNMEIENGYVNKVTLVANGLLAGFSIVLGYTIRKITMITVAVVAVLLWSVTLYKNFYGF